MDVMETTVERVETLENTETEPDAEVVETPESTEPEAGLVETLESMEPHYEYGYGNQAEWEALQASDADWSAVSGIRESVDNLADLAVCANFLLALLLGVCLCKIFSQYVTVGGRR